VTKRGASAGVADDNHIGYYHKSTVFVKIDLKEIWKWLAGQGLGAGRKTRDWKAETRRWRVGGRNWKAE
jgi:hypothetical protein